MIRDPEAELRRYLDPRERLIWSGTPKQGLVLRGADAFMIPFSLLWCGFAVFWEMSVIDGEAPFFFMLWGIPFVAVGLYMVVGRFLADARVRANTVYGLSDQRVIILAGLFTRSVTSLPLRNLQNVSLQERADRTGTILLTQPQPFSAMYQGLQWPGASRMQVPMLEMIADARNVHDELLRTQRAASSS